MKSSLAYVLSAFTLLGSLSPSLAADSSINTKTFPLKLYKQLAQKKKDSNFLVSPFSISSALGMTYNGALGKTKESMADVLGYDSASDKEINQRNKDIIDSLQSVGAKTKLEIANALFGNKNITFNKKFIDTNKQNYSAGLKAVDFSSSKTIDIINSWVSDKTHEKIPKIIESVAADDVLYLINAIYFKGLWENEFKKDATREKAFYPSKGIEKKVDMMHMNRDDFRYFETSDFQAIKLGYKDKRLSLCLFLPKESSSLTAFEASLTKENWKKWLSQYGSRLGLLALPRFKIEDNLSLKEPLSKIGMAIAFDPDKANFKAIAQCDDNLYISKVIHKTFMEVNEKGTEAAAATAVIMKATSAMVTPKVEPFTMILNRPFFFALHDSKSDTILFMGHVVEPKS